MASPSKVRGSSTRTPKSPTTSSSAASRDRPGRAR
jgi:hypothetical protein